MIPAQELRRLYVDEQRSPIQIAAAHGCTPETVRNWLAAFGIPKRNRSESRRLRIAQNGPTGAEKHAERLRKLWAVEGLTLNEIADALGAGVTGRTVAKWGHSLGLPLRSTVAPMPTVRADPQPFRPRSVISFLPDSPRLEMEFRRCVAAARMWRMWS
jgi:DNA-binding CsgD family transcriptional regulator